jgi:1-deoxy-D-xylulose-5-phosphate reductoisomerase
MSQGVAVLGSTGSIGTSALQVLQRQRERFHVVALTAYGSGDLLCEQAAAVGARYVGLVDGGRSSCERGGVKVEAGAECLIEAATHPDAAIVLNAIVGAAGLEATLAALRAGKRVALANKETLVMAGDLVRAAAEQGRGEIVPVDSEHSAVLQCVTGRAPAELRRLILTASGGPFREWPVQRLREATVGEALQHPTWDMGPKITVDSATLANKALEVIEAHHLFGLAYDAIEVVVHPQSIVHAFAELPIRNGCPTPGCSGSTPWRRDPSPSSRCARATSRPSGWGWRPGAPVERPRRSTTHPTRWPCRRSWMAGSPLAASAG